MTICFDMDGTIADLYGVENWLGYLLDSDPTPYKIAKPLIRMCAFARILNKLQQKGHKIAIISWLSKNSNSDYEKAVTQAKKEWLKKHLHSVRFDEVHIVPYGTMKNNYCASPSDILFDDEEHNRITWAGIAYSEENILSKLKQISS